MLSDTSEQIHFVTGKGKKEGGLFAPVLIQESLPIRDVCVAS